MFIQVQKYFSHSHTEKSEFFGYTIGLKEEKLKKDKQRIKVKRAFPKNKYLDYYFDTKGTMPFNLLLNKKKEVYFPKV